MLIALRTLQGFSNPAVLTKQPHTICYISVNVSYGLRRGARPKLKSEMQTMADATPYSPIRTPDQRLRVFVSSTLQELLAERQAAKTAISRLHLSPIMFELGARPHPPRDLYRAYLEQSHIFVGLYWERYGWVAPDEEVSGLEDEYLLCGDKPKLIYVKSPAPNREPRLKDLLGRIRDDDRASYKPFANAAELQKLLADDLALLLTERFEASLRTVLAAPAAQPTKPTPKRPTWPRPPTPLVGRTQELETLTRLLVADDVQLLTLLGPGGIGKSRLALALGARAAPTDGATFVGLAGLSDASMVIPTLADALGIPESEGGTRLGSLQEVLQDKAALLILDNFEQVADAAPELGALLTACPKLKTIVTSRAPLRLAAEYEFPVAPLTLPQPGAPLAELREAEAVTLFVARAQTAKPSFALTMANAEAVAELTRRLDGLPLALELAAARIKLLSPGDLLRRLDRRFELLAGGARDLPGRQQTLRGTIDWSYNLLQPEEQRTLQELSVFAGSLSLEAAEAVCTPSDASTLLDPLTVLVENNLVVPYDAPEEARFRLLESIRAYAQEKLTEAGEADVVQARHASYFTTLAQQAREHLLGENQLTWLTKLETEHDNLRAALAWLAVARSTPSDGETYGLLASSLIHFWWIRGYYSEGRRWLSDALTRVSEASPVRSRTLDGLGVLAWVQGDYTAAREHYEGSLALARNKGQESGVASSLGNLGILALERGDLEEAKTLFTEGLEINRRLSNLDGLAPALINLSIVTTRQGDYAAARTQLAEALAINRKRKDIWGVATALINLGDVLCVQGEVEEARAYFSESLQLAQDLGDRESLAYALEGFASIAAAQGLAERAAHLWGAAEALREASSNPRPPSSGADTYKEDIELMRADLGETGFAEVWIRGRGTPLQKAIAYALEVPTSLTPDTP